MNSMRPMRRSPALAAGVRCAPAGCWSCLCLPPSLPPGPSPARSAAATPVPPAAGSALAIVRSGGTGLYDATGSLHRHPARRRHDRRDRPHARRPMALRGHARRRGRLGQSDRAAGLRHRALSRCAQPSPGPQSAAGAAATPMPGASRVPPGAPAAATAAATALAAGTGAKSATSPATVAGATGRATATPARGRPRPGACAAGTRTARRRWRWASVSGMPTSMPGTTRR